MPHGYSDISTVLYSIAFPLDSSLNLVNTLMNELLDSLHAIGQDMQRALMHNDMNAFHQLLRKRSEMIQEISRATENKAISSEHAGNFARIHQQYEALLHQLKEKEQEMMRDLQNTQSLKKAHRSYHFDRKPRQLINKNVMG